MVGEEEGGEARACTRRVSDWVEDEEMGRRTRVERDEKLKDVAFGVPVSDPMHTPISCGTPTHTQETRTSRTRWGTTPEDTPPRRS